MALPGHSLVRQCRAVSAAHRRALLQARSSHRPRGCEFRARSAGRHLWYRRHVASIAGRTRRLDQPRIRHGFSGRHDPRSAGLDPHHPYRVHARSRIRRRGDGDVAHHARRPRCRCGRDLSALPRTGFEHRGRSYDLGKQENLLRVCLAGTGAFGVKHLEAMAKIPGIEVISLVGSSAESAREVAQQWKIPHWTGNLAESLALPGLDAVVLSTPTQMHAAQGEQCMLAGKHVMIEIPMADSLADSKRLVRVQRETGVIAMAGHTRRFNPSHQWIHKRILAGELKVLQMDVQTYFFRRTNTNALGKPRSWTDHLLWHHACHTVDLFGYQTGESISRSFALQGPKHPTLGIAMDMSIGLKTVSGAICTLSLSFNNDGPLGTFFRYICDNGTYIARYDELLDGKNNPIDVSKVDVSMNGIELQDREFFAAIRDGREPNASLAQCLPAMRTLGNLERQLDAKRL